MDSLRRGRAQDAAAARDIGLEQLLEHLRRIPRRKRLDQSCVVFRPPAAQSGGDPWAPVAPSPRAAAARPLPAQPVEQVQQRLFAPVQVFHEHDGGPIGDELLHEIDPGGVKALPDREGVELGRRFEAECHGEDLALAETRPQDGLRIVRKGPEMAFQYVCEGQYVTPRP